MFMKVYECELESRETKIIKTLPGEKVSMLREVHDGSCE